MAGVGRAALVALACGAWGGAAAALDPRRPLPAVPHAVFSKAHARELAHRWRPLPLVANGSVALRSPSGLDRYCRTMIECERTSTGYGVLQERSIYGLSLFLVERQTTPEGRALDLVRTSLSSADELEFLATLRHLRAWHRRLFPSVSLTVTDPYADEILRRDAVE